MTALNFYLAVICLIVSCGLQTELVRVKYLTQAGVLVVKIDSGQITCVRIIAYPVKKLVWVIPVMGSEVMWWLERFIARGFLL